MSPVERRRRSIRLPNYDYSTPGGYFVTICTLGRECLLGDVVEGRMRLSECGNAVQTCWEEIPAHCPNAEVDAFVVMPNHVHGIIVITETAMPTGVGAQHAAPLQAPATPQARQGPPPGERPVPPILREIQVARGSLGAIVRSFKAASTRRINALGEHPGAAIWQRNYYEHVIRSESSLRSIRRYIEDNPARWAWDPENPTVRQSTKGKKQ